VCPTLLTSISCASRLLCVAGDDSGEVLVSADPVGGVSAWQGISSALVAFNDFYAGVAVSCNSRALCLATNDEGLLISTDPASGPGAWQPIPLFGFGNQQPAVANLTCASASQCVGLTLPAGHLTVVSSAHPTAGVAAWRQTVIARRSPTATIVGPVCPSTSLCVAIDSAGNAEAASDPTGGQSEWTVKHVDRYFLDALACPSAALCVATDRHGDVVVGTKSVIDSSNGQH
jgi:hypothetical protein